MVQITKMSYARVFSLGNYENEKIGVECEVPAGADTTNVYIELKEVVENAHALRQDLRNYNSAKAILQNQDMYRGTEVKAAIQVVKNFETKYPNISDVKLHALLAENGTPIVDEQAF